jgi:hypothetical protein
MRKIGSKAVFSAPGRRSLVRSLLLRTIVTVVTVTNLSGLVFAAPPIEGNPISVQGPTAIPSISEGAIRRVVAADLDTNGHPDIAFGQADLLRIKANTGITTTQWAQTVTVGSAAYTIRDVHAVDIDRDGAIDLISASADDVGNSQLRLWQNPTSPFTNSWATGNTLTTSAISLTSIASADLDRNGTADLVSGGLDGIVRLWSNPLTDTQEFAASWPSPATIPTPGDQISQVLTADVDRDGLPDIIEAAGDGSSGVVRLWHNPGGAFSDTWTISNTLGTFATTVSSISVGDLDNDGAPDVLAGLNSGEIVAWRNPITSTQAFTTSWGSSSAVDNLSLPIVGLTVTDADHDGRLDVVATGSGTPSAMATWHNTGQPFSGGWSQIAIADPSAILALSAADFDRDGDDDFVTVTGDTETDTGGMQFWSNALIRSSARFQTPSVFPSYADVLTGNVLHAMDIHDMDRDGRPDIVVATLDGSLVLLQNNGSPFTNNWPATVIGSLSGFFSVVTGDLDGDGWPDIATSTTLSGTGGLVHIWRNDGTPFAGTWASQTVGAFPRQVMDLALGDVGREGHLQIVASTGITTTFDNPGLEGRDVLTSTNNRIWLLRPPAGDPFASNWISSTICTTTYSANSVALGDLDNDGWTDVVFGTDHAPSSTSENPLDWPNAYQVRACRSLANPYFPTGWQDYNIGRDDAPISVVSGQHKFWGAHIWSVAVGDLNRDGTLDVVSGGGVEGDYQILVYKNDGSPFDDNIWEPTAVGYGSRPDGGTEHCPGTYPEDCPWLEHGITDVSVGDLNSDGWPDLLSGFSANSTTHPRWINTGVPFGETVTDTHWIRHDLVETAMRPVYSVEAIDLDSDGRLDIAAVDSHPTASGNVRVWRNLGGSVGQGFRDDTSDTIEDGATESVLAFAIKHNGRTYDHALELEYLKIRLSDSIGSMNNTRAGNLFQGLQVYRDTNGDNVWEVSDSPVITVSTFSLDSGWQTLDFSSSTPPLATISAGQTVTYFVVANMQPTASQASSAYFRLYAPSHNEVLVRDPNTQASVSVEEEALRVTTRTYPTPAPAASIEMIASPTTIWADGASTSTITGTVTTVHGYPVRDGTTITFTTSAGSLPSSPYTTTTTDGIATAVLTSSTELTTATITGTVSVTATGTTTVPFVAGPRDSLRINDAPGPSGNEVSTHTMTADEHLTVYVAAYDALARFMDNPTDVTWGGTGVVSGHLTPTSGASSTTFAPGPAGTGTITVADGSGHLDATDTLTVTPGALDHFAFATISNQTAGQSFSVTITAQDEHGNTVTGYAGSATLADTTGTISPTATGSFVDGVWTGDVEITQAQSEVVITAQGGGASGISDSFDVGPGSLHHFVFGTISDQTVGQSFSVTITAQDEYSNTVIGYTGSATLTDTTGTISPTMTGGFVDGAWTGKVTITQIQSKVNITAQDGDVSGTSNSFDVKPDHFALAVVSSPQTAGEAFQVTITAQDGDNNTLTNYAGPAALSDTTGTINPTVTGSFTNGVWTGEVTITQAMTQVMVTAQDGSVSGSSNSFDVNPAAMSRITLEPAEDTISTTQSITYTVKAVDAYDNLVANVTVSATLTIETGAGGSWDKNVYHAESEGDWIVTATYLTWEDNAILHVICLDPYPFKTYLPLIIR